MYAKIAKWLSWALIIISVGILIWGTSVGFESNGGAAVDVLLRWGYVLAGAAVALVVLLGIAIGATNNPKSLIKLGLGLVVLAVAVFIVYSTAAGNPLVGYIGEQPDHNTLKLTDTLLDLTYICGGLAIAAIIFGEIRNAIRK